MVRLNVWLMLRVDYDLCKALPAHAAGSKVLSYPIEGNDRIIHRITDERQQRCNHGQIDLLC